AFLRWKPTAPESKAIHAGPKEVYDGTENAVKGKSRFEAIPGTLYVPSEPRRGPRRIAVIAMAIDYAPRGRGRGKDQPVGGRRRGGSQRTSRHSVGEVDTARNIRRGAGTPATRADQEPLR